MAKAISSESCVQTRQVLFGLKTIATYVPTNSRIVEFHREYSIGTGGLILQLLETPIDELESFVSRIGFLKPCDNGCYCLLVHYSKDHQFAAILMSKYVDFDYHPVGNIRFAQGDEAKTILRALIK